MEKEELKKLTEAVARAQPDHNGRSFFPPAIWSINNYGNLIVIGDDGRKVVISLEEARKLLPAERPAKEKPKAIAPDVMKLPVHGTDKVTPKK
jgi:hypothetical protein